ncbi:MAG: tRNA (adenosine(37)-N6)-dimethylallyltransferase MiaA [Chitinophagaceae bacterium]
MNKKTCILLTGPTAIGKTAVAIQIALHYKTSIISADSRQCYKEMTIGVAKPTPEQLQMVPHYFINSHSITEEVNAAGFEQYALDAVKKIFEKNDIAVMAGGTGLYIKAFCEGLDTIPTIDPAIRNEVTQHYEQKGKQWLQEQIKEKDPLFYEEGEIENPQRLMRALEVKLSTGISIREYQQGKKVERDFRIVKIGLELPKDLLHEQINQRVDQMMQDGLLNEVKTLYTSRSLNALQTVGYNELFSYLDGIGSLEEAVDLIKQHTRQYAKRQITWFKKESIEKMFDPRLISPIIEFIDEKLR